MPRGDGTGPMGTGPMSGRGMGFCAGFQSPGYMNCGFGGRFFGGRGRGFLRCFWRHAGAKAGEGCGVAGLPPTCRFAARELRQIRGRLLVSVSAPRRLLDGQLFSRTR